jgi:hypothetical protein
LYGKVGEFLPLNGVAENPRGGDIRERSRSRRSGLRALCIQLAFGQTVAAIWNGGGRLET